VAPFVAGAGEMPYKTFLSYCVAGAILWVSSITLLGYFLGNIPLIKANFEKVVLLIVFLSILPIILKVLKTKFNNTGG
jgi:membrane-associated protein